MSASTFADAFASAEAKYRAQVMFQTWGHLEQRHGTKQPGWFVFSIAAYSGHHVLLDSDWGKLPDSPGLYNAMMDYAARHGERGVVMRLEGHVSRLKNGRYRIGGRRYVVNLKPQKVRAMAQKVHPTTSPRHGFKFTDIPTRKGSVWGFPTIVHDRGSYAAILDSVYEMAEQVANANNLPVDAAIDDVLKSEGWTLLPTHKVMIRNRIADDRFECLFKETP